jgi:hypothetical protein
MSITTGQSTTKKGNSTMTVEERPAYVPKPEDFKCSYCGRVFNEPVRVHSGIRECWSCWNWRKMDGPMADYWAKKIDALFEQGPDMWDYTTWRRMGIQDEVVQALVVLQVVRDRCMIAQELPELRRSALGYSDSDGEDTLEE